ncbi:MAG: hypothetical protein II960_10855, partial [Synergistaceae bacterium]|nr:hypothetical protein [Synergistaceae bacterium]
NWSVSGTFELSGTPSKSLTIDQSVTFKVFAGGANDCGVFTFTADDPAKASKPIFITKQNDLNKLYKGEKPIDTFPTYYKDGSGIDPQYLPAKLMVSGDPITSADGLMIATASELENTWVVTGLPAGLSYDASYHGKYLSITGSPTETAKNQTFNVKITNGKGTVNQNFKINVGYEGDLSWNLEKDDTKAEYPTERTRLDGVYYVGGNVQSGPVSNDYKQTTLSDKTVTVTAGSDDVWSAFASGDAYVITATPGPITWSWKNLPNGLKAVVSSDTRYLTLSGTFKSASAFKEDDDGNLITTTPFILTAKNDGITGSNSTKSLTRTIHFKVYDTPKFTTSSLANMTTEKAYKQPINIDKPVEFLKVLVKEKAVADVAANWHDLTSTDAEGNPIGFSFKNQLEYDVAQDGTEGSCGELKWNPDKKQLEGTLTKIPAGGAISVRVLASNAKLAAAGTNQILLDKEIKVSGVAPVIVKDADSNLNMEADDTPEIEFAAKSGTYPIKLTAKIDRATAKKFDLGNADVQILNQNNGSDALKALGFTFVSATSTDFAQNLLISGDADDMNTLERDGVWLLNSEGKAKLVFTPNSADVKLESYKDLVLTISATNDQATKPVTQTFKIALDKDEALKVTGPAYADNSTSGGSETDINPAANEEITDGSRTYNVYMEESFDINFVIGDKLPLEITSPKNNEKQNDIVATITVSQDANGKEFPMLNIAGTPKEKKDAKFKLTAQNPLSGKKLNLSLTFKGNPAKGAAKVKPTIENADKVKVFDAQDLNANIGVDNVATIQITAGVPLHKKADDTTATGMRVYIDAATAKQYKLGNKDIEILTAGENPTDTTASEVFGVTATYTDGTTDASTGEVTPGELVLTFAAGTGENAKSTYKGLPITVEAKNYVTENIDKKPVTKTFKFDFNTDWKLSWTTNGLPDDTTGDVPADALNDEVSSDVT